MTITLPTAIDVDRDALRRAIQAVQLLRRHGFQVRRLSDGFPEWRAAGYPSTIDQPQT